MVSQASRLKAFIVGLTLEDVFDDGVEVWILPSGANDLEDVEQGPTGVGLGPG